MLASCILGLASTILLLPHTLRPPCVGVPSTAPSTPRYCCFVPSAPGQAAAQMFGEQ